MRGLFSTKVMMMVAALGLAACAAKPPPPPPPPPQPEPEREPPPPPKCEELKEKCVADGATAARIVDTGYVFTPPDGWIYAQTPEATIAQRDAESAVLVFSSFVPDKSSFKRGAQRSDKVTELAEIVGVKPGSRKPALRRPQTQDVGELKINLWDGYNSAGLKGSKRGDVRGELLVMAVPLDDQELFGIAFAAADDTEATEGILKAVQSLGPGDEEISSDDDEQDGKDDK